MSVSGAKPKRDRLPTPGRLSLREAVAIPLIFILIVAVWEGAVRWFDIPVYILPAPSNILLALKQGLALHNLFGSAKMGAAQSLRQGYYEHLLVTLNEALQGFAVGSSLGILLGALMGQYRLLERTVVPYIVAFQTLPKLAIAPLVVLWVGYGIASKVVVCALITFFPLVINTLAGMHAVAPERLDLMRVLNANRWKTFWMMQFPSALPHIFAGLDMAIVYSVVGAIVSEFVGGQRGLGVLLLQMSFNLDVSGMFSILLILGLIGVCLHLLVLFVQRRVIFWVRMRVELETV